MIADSQFFPKMRVVVACRSYDLQHDSRLRGLATSPSTHAVTLEPLDWDRAVKPVMELLDLAGRQFSARERGILAAPINLQVFADLVQSGETVSQVLSGAGLFDQLLASRAREFHEAGITWTPQDALGVIAQSMSAHQELLAPVSVLSPFARARDVWPRPDWSRRLAATLHILPQILVELYRAVDGDSAAEAEILDLFDYYLQSDTGEMRTKIGAYERH